jgi:hypothetical protein
VPPVVVDVARAGVATANAPMGRFVMRMMAMTITTTLTIPTLTIPILMNKALARRCLHRRVIVTRSLAGHKLAILDLLHHKRLCPKRPDHLKMGQRNQRSGVDVVAGVVDEQVPPKHRETLKPRSLRGGEDVNATVVQ